MALQVYDVSIEMVRNLAPVVEMVGRRDRALADQMRRAASSVPLNVAEGTESLGGNGRARFRTAMGSAAEVGAALDVATAWGYVPRDRAVEVKARLERVRRMLWPLSR